MVSRTVSTSQLSLESRLNSKSEGYRVTTSYNGKSSGKRSQKPKEYSSLAAALADSAIQLPKYVSDSGKKFEDSFSENSLWTFKKKYLWRDEEGEIKEDPKVAVYRLARTMAEVEAQYGATQKQIESFTQEFAEAIYERRFCPAGRIWTNAGTEIRGLFNCYVLPVEDSIDMLTEKESIFLAAARAAQIHKNGGGTGYNFSRIRPRGFYVGKSRGVASGIVSFIRVFDRETETINSGNRRGANMGIVNIDHPDILDFIYAKAETGEITNFNVSTGTSDEFMKAVKSNGFYTLRWKDKPLTRTQLERVVKNISENKLGGSEVGQEPKPPSLTVAENKKEVLDTYAKEIAGRVDSQNQIQLSAKYVFNLISRLAHKTADPGMIFLDRVNENNPLPQLGRLEATNPCGEQPLHPYDACNLGSIVVSEMTKINGNKREIDYDKIARTVHTAIRFMDNVNDANKGPLPEIEETTKSHRRIGLGIMGWADMLTDLGISYASETALKYAEKVMKFITDEAKKASCDLAIEKGTFEPFEGSTYDTGKRKDRVRNVQRTTIAPTGTISMLFNVSSGIEPQIGVIFYKNIRGGDTLKYLNTRFEKIAKERGFFSEDLLEKIENNHGSVVGIKEIPSEVQELFKASHDISIEAHIKMQAAFQKYTDNAISKTINMVNSSTVEDVAKAYMLAWETGCKGTTIYRDGSKKIQVLDTHKKEKKDENDSGKLIPVTVPDIMPAIRIEQRTPFGKMHATLTIDPTTSNPYELFANLGKAGEVAQADMEAFGRLVSLGLRSGIPLERIIEQLDGIGSGLKTPSRDGTVASLPDGVARVLKKYQVITEIGLDKVLTGKIDHKKLDAEVSERIKKKTTNGGTISQAPAKKIQEEHYGLVCPACNNRTLAMEEGCKKCRTEGCGFSEC